MASPTVPIRRYQMVTRETTAVFVGRVFLCVSLLTRLPSKRHMMQHARHIRPAYTPVVALCLYV